MAARMVFYIVASAYLIINSYVLSEEEIHFSYKGASGPEKWGSLSPKFSACGNGNSQSPIDIVKHNVVVNKNLKPLMSQYYSTDATLFNNGFNVEGLPRSYMHNCLLNSNKTSMQLRFGNNSGAFNLDGKAYTLKQIHWHSPSQHQIYGVQYDAELHMVHVADDGSVSVVASLYQYGHADQLLAKIQNKLTELVKEDHIALGAFNTWQLNENTSKYYRYVGSFTTPPCTENVIWHILGKVRSISREQVKALKAPLYSDCKNNARPPQPLNGRHVEKLSCQNQV